MTRFVLAANDLAALGDRDLDELYADLALAEAGSQSDMGKATASLAAFRTELAAAGADDVFGWLVRKGKAVFDRLWPAVKAVTCRIYAEDGVEGSALAGWVQKVA